MYPLSLECPSHPTPLISPLKVITECRAELPVLYNNVPLAKIASVTSDSLQPCGLQPARLLCPWGLSRQEYWRGLPCHPPWYLPYQGLNLSLMSIALACRFFTTSATWEAIYLTHDNVYISMLFSQLVPRLLPPLCPLIITPC